jgi:uncharacterized protein YjbI with pentapeptide repeats
MKVSANKLRQRWLSPEGKVSSRAVLARLKTGDDFSGLEIGEVDGRADLRGIALDSPGAEWNSVGLERVDFSYSSLSSLRLMDCAIESCLFDGASCADLRLWRSAISDSSFKGADLKGSALGAWSDGKGNVYRNVSFAGSNLDRSGTSAAVYEDCDFSGAKLDRINFWQSSLVRCRFAGEVRDVIFEGRRMGEGKPDPNPMIDVDFSEAKFDGCEFRGVSFDRVLLPSDPDLVLISDAQQVDRALAALQSQADGKGSAVARLMLEHAIKLLNMGGPALMNLRDFPAGADAFMSALAQAGWEPK